MESEDPKKMPYSPPTFVKLTPEQAKKLVADRKNCGEEASDFFDSLSLQQPNNAPDQTRKRSA
jgi:hypothetical protein